MHCSQIVLGVLKVILRRNPVAAQSCGASQRQITLVVSLGVLRLRIRAVEPGQFGSADLRFSLRSHIGCRCAVVALNSEVVVMSIRRSRGLEPCEVHLESLDAVDGVMRRNGRPSIAVCKIGFDAEECSHRPINPRPSYFM